MTALDELLHEFLQALFALVCGQRPDHALAAAGLPMPLCQRCLGLYLGALVATLASAALRPCWSATARAAWIVAALQLVPAGLGWPPQGEIARLLSGYAFGAAIAVLLAAVARGADDPATGRMRRCVTVILLGAAVMIVAATQGGHAVQLGLSCCAAAGLGCLVWRVIATFAGAVPNAVSQTSQCRRRTGPVGPRPGKRLPRTYSLSPDPTSAMTVATTDARSAGPSLPGGSPPLLPARGRGRAPHHRT